MTANNNEALNVALTYCKGDGEQGRGRDHGPRRRRHRLLQSDRRVRGQRAIPEVRGGLRADDREVDAAVGVRR